MWERIRFCQVNILCKENSNILKWHIKDKDKLNIYKCWKIEIFKEFFCFFVFLIFTVMRLIFWINIVSQVFFFLRRMLFPTLMPFHCFVMQVLVVASLSPFSTAWCFVLGVSPSPLPLVLSGLLIYFPLIVLFHLLWLRFSLVLFILERLWICAYFVCFLSCIFFFWQNIWVV